MLHCGSMPDNEPDNVDEQNKARCNQLGNLSSGREIDCMHQTSPYCRTIGFAKESGPGHDRASLSQASDANVGRSPDVTHLLFEV